jgi:polyhydroxyalkanoate synthesis regulator phasin
MSDADRLLEVLALVYSKKYNVPPDEAKKIIQPLLSRKDKLKELQEFISRLDSIKPVIQSLPDEAKAPASLLILKELMGSTKTNTSATDVVIAKELIKSLRDEDPQVKALAEEIKQLREMYSKLIEQMGAKSAMDELRKDIDELKKALAEIRQREAQAQQPPQQPPIASDVVKKLEERLASLEEKLTKTQTQPSKTIIAEALKELDDTIKLAQQYGLIKAAPSQQPAPAQQAQMSPEELAEQLKKYGYKVERITPENIDKFLEEYKKRVRDELERELEVEKARIQSITDIIKDVIREVGGPIIKTITDAQKEYLNRLLYMRLQQMVQGSSSSQQGGQDTQTTSAKEQQKPQQ